ncbi:E3 ubiquitin-protein ligase AMFR-like [Asterias amurensis]|uniref:E3 ubiquitin-protein ligase AMFR-like n=1 Tax=Asterias amurensis TaxID=7602 RepID=UPI003AB6DD77
MPVLVLQPPSLPALQTYIALSCLSLAWCFLYARETLETVENAGLTHQAPDSSTETLGDDGRGAPGGWSNGANESETSRYLFGIQADDGEIIKLCRIMMADVWSVLSLINLAFCLLVLVGRLLQHIVFGELRASERQHLRDKLWKFIFYKFIIIFGVLNVQTLEEMVMWMVWFAALAFLHTLSGLCKDRFEYLCFSPSPMGWAHGKVLFLLATILCMCKGLIFICCYMGALQDWNVFLFTISEVILLEIRTVYVLIRYGIHFYDLHYEGVWEKRGTIMYYSDLIMELSALCVDFVHHFHMLLWGNVFLSMASLVICMELRFLYSEIQRRIKRHRNFRQVVSNMEANFPLATDEELRENNDDCAICWEEMKNARKLPCNHLFHNNCLRSWLEHETSCPTCRHTLNIRPTDQPTVPTATPHAHGVGGAMMDPMMRDGQAQPVRPRRGRNHFFHFDGSQIASWIPSFSVEVSHRHLLQQRAVHTSQLTNMATQVQQMFPNYPVHVLLEDLRVTQAVEVTIDNILEGRLVLPPETTEANATTPADAIQTPSSNPSLNANANSRRTGESPSLYDTPGRSVEADVVRQRSAAADVVRQRSVAADMVRRFGEMEEMVQNDRHQGVDERGDRSAEMASVSTSSVGDDGNVPFTDGPQALPGRFSKSSAERETILRQRKELLMKLARRRFQDKQAHSTKTTASSNKNNQSASNTLRNQSANQNPSSRESSTSLAAGATAPSSGEEDRAQKRFAAYEAAMRRMNQQH